MRLTLPLLLAAACATVETPPPAPPPKAEAPPPAAAKPAPPPPEAPPLLELPEHTRPLWYALELTLVPSRERFSGREDIDLELTEPRQVLWLHGRGLNVTVATAGGKQGTWEQVHAEGLAKLTFVEPLPKGKHTLHLEWDAPWDAQSSGLYLTRQSGETYVGSQFETHFARRAWPCFDDPGFKTPYELALIVDPKHVAVTNTNEASRKPADGGLERITFNRTPPLPTYLLDFSVGPFDVVTPPPLPPNDVRKTPLQVRGLAPKGRGAELKFALEAGGELLVALERYFGIPYPYEKLDHIALPDNFGGAMENAGAITYVDNLLLFREGVSSEESRTDIAAVMAHEMAHQWFGDLVTMRWWTDIWLNESFAEWIAIRTVEAWRPAMQLKVQSLGPAHHAMDDDSLQSSRTVRHPLEKMEEVGDQFDNLTYQKGSAVLAMFEQWLGGETFRAGVHEYMSSHAHGTGGTAELLAALSRASGKQVTPAFESFLNQAGVPLVSVKVVCEPKAARLELQQRRWLPAGSKADAARTWKVPVCARWGEGKAVNSACTLLEGASAALLIPSGACPDWVFPNPGAAGYYRWSLEPGELKKLQAKGQLSVAERLSFANALHAAVKSGAVQLADAMPALEWLAKDTEGEVALQTIGALSWAYEYGVDPGLQPKVAAYAKQLYRPRLEKLGWKPGANETPGTRRLRSALIGFLALQLHEPATAKQAAKLGRDYAGADGRFHPEAVSPDLAADVLAAAVKADAKLVPVLVERLGTLEDGEVRQRVIRAVAATEDDGASAAVLSLWKGDRLRQSELFQPYALHLQEPKTRERAWQQLQTDFDPLMQKLEPFFRGYFAQVTSVFCDEAHAVQTDTFLRARLETYPEMRRQLEHALEDIRNCAALKQTQQVSAAAFFSRTR